MKNGWYVLNLFFFFLTSTFFFLPQKVASPLILICSSGSCIFKTRLNWPRSHPVDARGTSSSTWLSPPGAHWGLGEVSRPRTRHPHRRAKQQRAEQLPIKRWEPEWTSGQETVASCGGSSWWRRRWQQLILLSGLRWTRNSRQRRRRQVLRKRDEGGRQTSDRERRREGEAERGHEAEAKLPGRAAGQARQHVN